MTGLQPGTTYHYRILAVSSAGTRNGKDRTFKTASVPLSVQIAGVPNPVVFGNPFVVEGNLSGTGAANHEVVLQANQFPYLGWFSQRRQPRADEQHGRLLLPLRGPARKRAAACRDGRQTRSLEPRDRRGRRRARLLPRPPHPPRGFVRLYGTVAPAEVGALVGFQLLRPGKSINQGGTVVKTGTSTVSRFSRVIRVRHPGLYRALVKITDGAHVSNYSSPMFVR